jgi:hypothetical protein
MTARRVGAAILMFAVYFSCATSVPTARPSFDEPKKDPRHVEIELATRSLGNCGLGYTAIDCSGTWKLYASRDSCVVFPADEMLRNFEYFMIVPHDSVHHRTECALTIDYQRRAVRSTAVQYSPGGQSNVYQGALRARLLITSDGKFLAQEIFERDSQGFRWLDGYRWFCRVNETRKAKVFPQIVAMILSGDFRCGSEISFDALKRSHGMEFDIDVPSCAPEGVMQANQNGSLSDQSTDTARARN